MDDVIKELRQELASITRELFQRGLSSGTSGNTSARIPGQPDHVLIKASGVCFGHCQSEDFVLVDLEGNILDGDRRPSKEYRFHLGIYKERPEVQAIVHGHSAYATAYATAKGELPIVTAAAEAGLNKVGIVDFAAPGSPELADMVVDAFKDQTLKAAVLVRHGFVTVGQDIRRAYYLGDVLEDNAKVACLLEQIG
ncbi:MAG: class II aldolase/adducin family protein [Desulfitobacteriaceae bacterium]